MRAVPAVAGSQRFPIYHSKFLIRHLQESERPQGTRVFVDLLVMAIGWGKSFEEQVEEANQRASDRRAPKVPLEDRVREQRLKSLEVSRTRIERQLDRAVHPAHRETLMKALQALLTEIEDLSDDGREVEI